MKRVLAVGASLLLVVAIAALFIGGDHRPPRGPADTTVGSIILDSGATIAELVAVEDLRIDGATEQFEEFYRLIVAPDGSIIVPQLGSLQYLRYDAAGNRLGHFGARGNGPCEFISQADHRAGWLGDTLWIFDPNAHRVTYFDADGQCLGDDGVQYAFAAPRDLMRFPLAMSSLSVWGIHDGMFLAMAHPWNLPKPSTWIHQRPILAIGSSGMIHRLVGDFPWMTDRDTVRTLSGRSTNLPFRLYPILEMSADGSRIGYMTFRDDAPNGGHVRLVVLNPLGDTVFAREYEFLGTRVPDNVVDSVIEARAVLREAELNDAIRRETRKRMSPYYQPVRALKFGRDSTIWIGLRWTPPFQTWIMLDAHGTPRASVKIPSGRTVAVVDGNNLWAIDEDADDVPSVVRYRLTTAKRN